MALYHAAEILCATLEHADVSVIFGMVGTQNIPLFEALRKSRIRTIAATNETAASFMANGYYRASGRTGVLLTIPGPGFMFALPGIAEAKLDSAALLHVVVRSGDGSSRQFQHQHFDLAAINAGLYKQILSVQSVDEIQPCLIEALAQTQSGEPGPVLLIIAPELFREMGELRLQSVQNVKSSAKCEHVIDTILAARKLLIFAGLGAQGSVIKLRAVAEKLTAPVATTCSGRGVISAEHELCLGYETAAYEELNSLFGDSDLVLCLGAKLSHNGTAGFKLRIPPDKMVQVDTSVETLSANSAKYQVMDDCGDFLENLLLRVQSQGYTTGWTNSEIAAVRNKIRQKVRGSVTHLPQLLGVQTQKVDSFFESLQTLLPTGVIFVTDSGFHQSFARAFLAVQEPRGLICPTDLQSMGFAIPAAIGAKLAAPEREIVVFIGDGGMQISAMELVTAVREGVKVTIFLLNDGTLGLIKRQQIEQYGQAFATDTGDCDFSMAVGASGAKYSSLLRDTNRQIKAAMDGQDTTVLELFLTEAATLKRKATVQRTRQTIKGIIRRIIH